MDHKSRASNSRGNAGGFRWGATLGWVALSLVCIGVWVSMLGSIIVHEITRGSVTLLEPTEKMLVGASFVMLFGVVLLSIQIVAIVTHLTHGGADQRH